MSPIYTYECEKCNFRFVSMFFHRKDKTPICPSCDSAYVKKVPSITGYRQDHTVIEK